MTYNGNWDVCLESVAILASDIVYTYLVKLVSSLHSIGHPQYACSFSNPVPLIRRFISELQSSGSFAKISVLSIATGF